MNLGQEGQSRAVDCKGRDHFYGNSRSSTNTQAEHPKGDEAVVFEALNVSVAVLFTSEVAIKMVAHEIKGFCWGCGRKWNRFDFITRVFTNIDILLRLTFGGMEFYAGLESLGLPPIVARWEVIAGRPHGGVDPRIEAVGPTIAVTDLC